MAEYISVTDTAKLIRKELKKNFASTKFSVRSESYAGGASIDIKWLDGPSASAVEKVTKLFQGSSFDGMIDLRSYHNTLWEGKEVHFGADHVSCRRNYSRVFAEALTAQFCTRYGIDPIEVVGNENDAWVDTRFLDHFYEHHLQKLLHNTDAKDMYRVYEAEDEREAREQVEWEKGAAQREREAKAEREKEQKERAERDARRQREQAEQARKAREEQARRRQSAEEQEWRDAIKNQQRQVLSSRANALAYLGLNWLATEDQIKTAFRDKVRQSADGNGGYRGDMDFLVHVKEKALQR